MFVSFFPPNLQAELQEEIYELLFVQETEGLSMFWITMAIFTGFLIIIVLENVTPEFEL